jgi:CheY-like chemotaxis protein
MMQATGKPFFKKVLVIDDSETDRYIAKRMLEKYQFCKEVIVQESAPKALQYLRSLEHTTNELPEFILLDIRMPQMDGFEFLDEYAKLPESVKTNCVIMMLSTSLDPHDHQRAESSIYINRFFNKPFSKENIEMLEKEYLAKRSQHSEDIVH